MDVKLKAVLLKEKTKTGIVTKEGRSTVDTKEDNSCLNKTTPAAEGRNVVEGVGKEQCSMFSNETFSCEKCEAEFSSDAQAIQHANSEHAAKGQMDYQCDVCLLNFKDRQLFKRHRNSHGKGRDDDDKNPFC